MGMILPIMRLKLSSRLILAGMMGSRPLIIKFCRAHDFLQELAHFETEKIGGGQDGSYERPLRTIILTKASEKVGPIKPSLYWCFQIE